VEVVAIAGVEEPFAAVLEFFVVGFDTGAPVGLLHFREVLVGVLEAAEAPGGGDDAVGEAELEDGLGGEVGEDGVAEEVEIVLVFAGVAEVG
jgi:hypothetical protein